MRKHVATQSSLGPMAKKFSHCKWFLLSAFVVIMCASVTATFAQTETLSYDYPEQGFAFVARLYRVNGRLSSYELRITNTGKVSVKLAGVPQVPSEVTGIYIYRIHKDGRRELIDQGTVGYASDGAPTPKVRDELLKPGETKVIKGTFVDLFNAYKGVVRNTSIALDLTNPNVPRASFELDGVYDIGFYPSLLGASWPNKSESESNKASGFVCNDVAFNDRLTFRSVEYESKAASH